MFYLHSLHLLLDGFHGDPVGGAGGESGGAVSRDEGRRLAKGWIPDFTTERSMRGKAFCEHRNQFTNTIEIKCKVAHC